MKACALSRALAKLDGVSVFHIHTGQHYDYEMSGSFYDELGLPAPEYNLGTGSGPQGAQTAAILRGVEEVLLERRPALVVVLGDTNSTIGGALAASKLGIPVAHVEAGLRSGDMRMPEEINRVVTDRLSALLFCPTESSVELLKREGITEGVRLVGDVMVETFEMFRDHAQGRSGEILARLGLERGRFAMMTVHRAENTSGPDNIRDALDGCERAGLTVFFPAHPRTSKLLRESGLRIPKNVILSNPVSYIESVAILSASKVLLTDSGGMQKEAYLAGVPCLTLRETTEWGETVEAGWNLLVGTDPEKIANGVLNFSPAGNREQIFGPADAADRIAGLIEKFLKKE